MKRSQLFDSQLSRRFLADQITVSYIDCVYVGFLFFAKRFGEDNYQRIIGHSESFDKLYNACEKWLQRKD